MSHPLTACMSEIEMLQGRIREKNARIEALEAELQGRDEAKEILLDRIEELEALAQGYDTAREVFTDRIEVLEAALREIARAVLAPEQEK